MLLRRVARPMLAAIFISGGINSLRLPQGHVQAAEPVLDAVTPAMDKAVEAGPVTRRPDDELLVKIDGGVKIVAGSLLALGKFPRLASTALAASLIPTTLAAHRFWEETDPEARGAQRIHFFKNIGLLGGLLIAAADTEGKPSLGWRGRRAAKLAGTAVSAQTAAISGAAHDVGGKVSGAAHDVGGKVSGVASDASGAVAGVAAGLAGLAPGAAVSARTADLSSRASDLSAEWAERAAKAKKRAEKRAAKLQKTAEKRGAALQKVAEKRGAELKKRAAKRGATLQKAAAKKAPELRDQAARLGHDLAGRAATLGAEAVHQAEGAAKDARKRVAALSN